VNGRTESASSRDRDDSKKIERKWVALRPPLRNSRKVAKILGTIDRKGTDARDAARVGVDAAYACYRDAFLATSSPVSSPEEGRAVLLAADPRPRVLLAHGEAVAVLRVAWLDEAARAGELRFVCRDPRLRGQRMGDRALSEAFRVLRRMDASSAQLSVASTNRAALDLYDRWGFRRVAEEQEDVFRIALSVGR
jgi:ribosomal protein S18 acetylase RimI-like enzyme